MAPVNNTVVRSLNGRTRDLRELSAHHAGAVRCLEPSPRFGSASRLSVTIEPMALVMLIRASSVIRAASRSIAADVGIDKRAQRIERSDLLVGHVTNVSGDRASSTRMDLRD